MIGLLAAFGWAVVQSAKPSSPVARFQKPRLQPAVRRVEVLEETPAYRLIKHPLGQTKVPLDAERIASLTPAGTDSLVALGIKPVLATTSWKGEASLSYLADHLQGVPLIRQFGTTNLEAIFAAKPDLIFAGSNDARLYAQLSKIAPTVCLSSDASAYRENRILDVGDVVGRPDAARARVDQLHHRIADAKATLAKSAANQPVVFLRFRRNTCTIYTRASMFGPLLFEQLGLTPDSAMPVVMLGGGWDVLSVERLSTLEAEHIFMVVDPDSEIYLHQVEDTPIWRDLPAVRHGHVHRVLTSTWLSGDGVLGCDAIIDDVLAAILPGRSDDERP